MADRMLGIGIVAGIATACSWAISSTIHSHVSRMLGVHSFMMLRQPLALTVLFLLCLGAGQFQPYPLWGVSMAFFSGVMGVAICDWCLYEAILRIGIRPALVCHSLYVCCTALLGVFLLGESLGFQGFLGIAIATAGVIVVIVAEQRHTPPAGQNGQKTVSPAQRRYGVGLALFSAVAVALGFIGTKEALQQGIPPLMTTFLRNFMATIVLWCAGLCLHKVHTTFSGLRAKPLAVKLLLAGCVFGPVGGIWLSTVALDYAPAAVASTLIGLQPVALLVVTGIWERRCPSLGSILGSCTACAGAAVLLLR